MPTPKRVSQIKSQLLRPALTSHFEVQIPIPSDLRGQLGTQQDTLNLSCCEATLPGSSLATLETNNDYTGVTEKHAYRRMFDGQIDFTFYVDAVNYLPIKFFESWIRYAMNENTAEARNKNYNYRVKYPDSYITDQGLIVRKFERDYRSQLTYEFIRSFPLSISSMPVSYEASSLLKCTVTMNYIRYVINEITGAQTSQPTTNPILSPIEQAQFNNVPDYFLNPEFGVSTTTGGVSSEVARASGNTIDRRVEAGLPYVGRNVGPGERFAGI